MSDNVVHLSKFKYISVEHVLPQTPKDNSEWRKIFSDDKREYWTNKIANLVLISKRKNSSLSNKDFKDKKEKYLKSRYDVFQANKIFVEQNDEWSPVVLERRQEDLVRILVGNCV